MYDFPYAASAVLLVIFLALLWVAYTYGRFHQSNFDRRYELRLTEKIMADLSALKAQMDRLILLVSTPKPEDPAIQAGIDALAAEAKAAADAAQP